MSIEEKIKDLIRSGKYQQATEKSFIMQDSSMWSLRDPLNVVVWVKKKEENLIVFGKSLEKNTFNFHRYPYRPYTYTPSHQNDFFELSYVEKGTLKKRIGGERVDFYENEICMVDGANPHCEYMEQSDDVYCFLMLSPAFFEKSSFFKYADLQSEKFIKETILAKTKKYKALRFTPKTKNTKVQKLFEQIIEELLENETGYVSLVAGYVERIFNLLVFEYRITLTKSEKVEYGNKLFSDIEQYMQKNYRTVTEKSLAEFFYYTPEHINRLIKKYSGLSYSKYLQKIRLDKAKQLLKESDLPVEEIAREIGYSNLSFFYRLFRQTFHTTPNEFRNS